MTITATSGRYSQSFSLPTDLFYIRDILDKLRAGNDGKIKIKITECLEIPQLEGMEFCDDIYKLNFLAERIEQFDRSDPSRPDIQMAALIKAQPERTVDELIRMTFSDSVSVYPCSSCEELGEMVIDNDMLPELEDVPDKILPMIDKAWVGRTFAEREQGVFVDGYYCLPSEYNEPQIDVQIEKPANVFFSLVLCPPGTAPGVCGQRFGLPVLDDRLDSFSLDCGCPLDDMRYYDLRSSIPMVYEPNSISALNNLAVWLSTMEYDEVVTLKAVLQTLPKQRIEQVLDIAQHINEYELDRSVRSYDDFGQKYLQKFLPPEFSARALDDTNLTDLGCNVLFMKGGTITTYGALSGKGQQLYTAIIDEQMQEETEDEDDTESEDESSNMAMGGM